MYGYKGQCSKCNPCVNKTKVKCGLKPCPIKNKICPLPNPCPTNPNEYRCIFEHGLCNNMDCSVLDVIKNSNAHRIFYGLIDIAGLSDTISNLQNQFTIFAPTDEVIRKQLLPDTLEAFTVTPGSNLVYFLKYFILPDFYPLERLKDNMGRQIPTVLIQNFKRKFIKINGIDTVTKDIIINDAFITIPDLTAANGVVHVINKLIYPYPIYSGN